MTNDDKFMSNDSEMPRYNCHKQVWALQISSIHRDKAHNPEAESNGSAMLTPKEAGYAPVYVDAEYMQKHKPVVGGYYVVYKGGYKSYSPADAFEDGYTLV